MTEPVPPSLPLAFIDASGGQRLPRNNEIVQID